VPPQLVAIETACPDSTTAKAAPSSQFRTFTQLRLRDARTAQNRPKVRS
jgi:hypothetical protein